MDSSFSRSLALAAGLHALVALGGRSLAAPALALPRVPAPAIDELGIVVETEPPQAAEPGPALGASAVRGAPAAAPTRLGRGPVPLRGQQTGGEIGDADGVATPSVAASVPELAERPVDLGLGWLWARPGLPDRPKADWRTGADAAGGLGSGLEARDRARGLARGGVVATLARSAAIGLGPSEGEATFSVLTDRDGKVTGVSLVEARGGAWDGTLGELRRSLARKRLRVPPGANGLAVQVLVRARVQLPSGARPGETIRARGAGAEFDVADLGARPGRVVSARVTNERLL